jgi:hypothetical protein
LRETLLENVNEHDHESARISKEKTIYYILIRGPSYGSLDFEARESIRAGIRERLEAEGIRFTVPLFEGIAYKAGEREYFIPACHSPNQIMLHIFSCFIPSGGLSMNML